MTPRLATLLAVPGLVLATAVLVPAASSPAQAGSPSVRVTTPCGRLSTSLAVAPHPGSVDTRYTLTQHVRGVEWQLTLSRNGKPVARVARTTAGAAGSVTWRVSVAASGATVLETTARRGRVTCRTRARIVVPVRPTPVPTATPTPAAPTTTPPSPVATPPGAVDRITVSKCYTNATRSSGGEMLIKADSSDPVARLFAYRPDGSLIGEVQNGGGGRYGGTVMPYQPYDPGTVTIRSSSGGRVTVTTTPFRI